MQLPIEYRWLKAHNFKGLTPWYFIDSEKSEGIRKEYALETGKDIIPFARRQDCDDIAGFEIINGETKSKVLTIHLSWSGKIEIEGFSILHTSIDLFSWFSDIVIPATKDWMSEDDLSSMNNL